LAHGVHVSDRRARASDDLFSECRDGSISPSPNLRTVAECVIFLGGVSFERFAGSVGWIRSFVTIVIANLASFGAGEVLNYFRVGFGF
jgi:hypothetical protein